MILVVLKRMMVCLFLCFEVIALQSCSGSDEQQQESVEADGQEEEAQAPSQEEAAEVEPSDQIQPSENVETNAESSGSSEIPSPSLGIEPVNALNNGLGALDNSSSQSEIKTEETAEPVSQEEQFPSQDTLKYFVMPGDTLSKIALRVYGDLHRWQEIHAATPSIKNPNVIYPGEIIIIPLTSERAKTFAQNYTKEAKSIKVTVKAGDTLSKIAAQNLGSSEMWRQIYKQNQSQISNPDVISVGQVLTISVMSAH